MNRIEQQMQIEIVDYCRAKNITAIHIANERKCGIRYGKILKRMGVTAGVSDLLVFHPKREKFGFWLELKAPGKKATESQRIWLNKMEEFGYHTGCVDNIDDAIKLIDIYVS